MLLRLREERPLRWRIEGTFNRARLNAEELILGVRINGWPPHRERVRAGRFAIEGWVPGVVEQVVRLDVECLEVVAGGESSPLGEETSPYLTLRRISLLAPGASSP